ncbi:MAG: ATP-binding protein [Thermoleophilia bacterium]|nr:ATP-binding protein [Thermoleophilia bacterium]
MGHTEKACRCTAASVERYRARISGPLLDRVDALIEVPPLTLSCLEQPDESEKSVVVRDRVAAARAFRRERLVTPPTATDTPLEKGSHLTRDARALLREALVRESLSGRAYVRTVNLARTIADLDNELPVRGEHIAEALALRLDRRRIGFE